MCSTFAGLILYYSVVNNFGVRTGTQKNEPFAFANSPPVAPLSAKIKEWAALRGPLVVNFPYLNVVVQRELVGMRPQADGIHFFDTLVINVGAEQFLGEDISLEQEGVIFFEGH